MASEAHSCEPLDPLAGYWGLSLFPKTSGVLPDPSIPYNPDDDLQSMHNHLRSTLLQNPIKFLNEAKSIIDGDMNLINSENQAYQPSAEENENFKGNAQENHRERRPGMGRKRARFSLKPNSSLPAEELEQNLDIDKLKDPVEFFNAYERMNNAKREIQKQMGGVSFDSNQHRATTRQRRPGIRGGNQRRPAKYKHLYSLEASAGDEIVSSQETFELSSFNPVDQVSQGTGACVSSREEELENSSAVVKTKLDEILGELFHQSFEGAEEDQAFNVLQEKLQVKPIVVEKISFPDFPDNRMFNMKSLGRDPSRTRKALVNIDNMLNGIYHEALVKPRLKDRNSLEELASPTPPKSPFAPVPLLQKRKSISNAPVDPFSILHIDHMSSGNSSRVEKLNNKSDTTVSGNLFGVSDKLKSPVIDEGVALKNLDFIEVAGGDFAKTSETLVEHNFSEPEASINVAHTESEASTKQNFGGWIADDVVTTGGVPINVDLSTSNINMEEEVRGRDTNEVLDSGEDTINSGHDLLNVDLEKNVGSREREDELCNEDDGARDESKNTHTSDEKDEAVHEALASTAPYSLDTNLGEPLDQLSVDQVEVQRIDECMNPQGSFQDQCVEQAEKVPEITINKQREPKLHPQGKRRKKDSRRESLEGAGTCWKAGLRRSTRMRTRPLEFWKGEKLVFGRIHSSLPTVIGMKYASPAKKGGEPALKVKSFVSDEYKELLERASYY